MASLKIHQDVYNFERKRKGFTSRQITCIVLGIGVVAGFSVLIGYVAELGYPLALSIGLCAGLPVLTAGFLPLYNMPAEEFMQRLSAFAKRGNALNWEGESIANLKGETSREYQKKSKKAGFECTEIRPGKKAGKQ